MSAEVREMVYLRCDGVSFGGHRCLNTYGAMGVQPATGDALQGLAGNARLEGWTVHVHNEGLKGWSASSFCREHRPAVNP